MIFKALKAFQLSFNRELKIKYLFVFIFQMFSSLLEVISVALVIPFTMLLFQRDIIMDNNLMSYLFQFFSFSSYDSFVIFFSFFFLSFLIFSNICLIVNVWFINYLTYKLEYNLILKIFKNFLHLGYENKVNLNSADLVSKLTIQIKRYIEGVVNSFMIIFQKMITVILIIIFLGFVDLKVTFFTLLLIFLVYTIFYKSVRKLIYKKGSEMTEIFSQRQRLISESIFGIKEVILYNLQKNITNNLINISEKLTKNVAFVRTTAVFPRYFLEIIIFLILIPSALLIFSFGESKIIEVLPIFSSFIFGLYKLSPAAQSIFTSIVSIKSEFSAFENFRADMNTRLKKNKTKKNIYEKEIFFKKNILFKNITFNYKNNKKNILNNINIKIKKNTTTGITGPSGSGKTSLLKLILGFLKPASGKIFIDEYQRQIYNDYNWMKKIGYVSQFTFLFDDTLLKNITMFQKNKVDKKKVIDCINKAGLSNFFYKKNQNLNLIIGEGGSKLSGGEIQRIGLARALYRNPEILILDEFTSALDNEVEKDILNTLKKLKKKLTIILSTHKSNILYFCDKLYHIQNGKLKLKKRLNEQKNIQ